MKFRLALDDLFVELERPIEAACYGAQNCRGLGRKPMSQVVGWARRAALAFPVLLLPASIAPPAAHAYDEPNIKRIDALRIDATDMLTLGNRTTYVVRIDFSDPTYGAQTRTLAPMEVTDETNSMCAIKSDLNPTPDIYVTFSPGTPEAVTLKTFYPSASSDWSSLEAVQATVAEALAAFAKSRQQVYRAKIAVSRAKAALAKAKASNRPAAIRSAKVTLVKARKKLAGLKVTLADAKASLVSARQDLEQLQGYIAYCQSRRIN
ncbi:hypothetical protein EUA06_08295 [Nocardioides glacieisoli]|uniref:Uncharacterized protein n=1 Tax=Nocardioides glacieisoli TaxID=1168730 RepID=A0A4V1RK77_9ACTN|nr:hypothetical protein [Nocardioides glacieisoli]RYB91322.1 hypothetical protein EUA06_08295 [Nocardioides glacieisoli]